MENDDRFAIIFFGLFFGALVLYVLFVSAASVGRTRACYEALAAGADVVCEARDE